MKRNIFTIVLVVVVFIAGYFIGDSSAINKMNEGIDKSVAEQVNNKGQENSEEEENKDELPIKLDDVAPTINILDPNSIDVVYMEATFVNNTKYPITSYSAKVLLKDSNETTYLSTHDTVMPGEESPKFDGFGPKTSKEEDYEILTLDIRAATENDKTLHIGYDIKLNEASWSEY